MPEADDVRDSNFSTSARLAGFLSSPAVWLGVVAVVYAVLQFVSMDMGRFFAWDEAVYASEVSRFADSVGLAAHRARGVTLVVWPITQLTNSILALRLYLIGITSVGLFLSFLSWTRVISWGAPVAAAIFTTSWLTVFYGSEVMPNLYSAMLVVAALGLMFAYISNPRRGLLVGLGLAVSAVAFFRPLDGATTVVIVLVATLLVRSKPAAVAMASASLGAVVGLVPWLVEAWIRFGGPVERLERAREIVGRGVNNNLVEYLRLLDGPTSGPAPTPDIAVPGVLWLLLILGLAVLGVLIRGSARVKAMVALVGSALMSLPYLLLSEATAPRFMLPAVALLAIAASVGSLRVSSNLSRPLQVTWIFALVIVLGLLNVGALVSTSSEQSVARTRSQRLAEALEIRTEPGSCFFLSSSGFPQISLATGCIGGRFSRDLTTDLSALEKARESGFEVYLLLSNAEDVAYHDRAGGCDLVSGLADRRWHICPWEGRP